MTRVFIVNRDDSDIFYVFNENGRCKVMYHPDDFHVLTDAIEDFAELHDMEVVYLGPILPHGSVPPFQIDNETFLHDNDEKFKSFLKTIRYYIKNYEVLKVMGL